MRKIINEWDPINLLAIGAPEDEYDYEIRQIQGFLESHQGISADDLGREIMRIFTQAFTADVFTRAMSECIDIADQILTLPLWPER